VDYATADNSATTADGDYTNAGNTLTFAGTAGETQTFVVLVTGDHSVELDEAFNVNLSEIQASGRAIDFADSIAIGNIINDDEAKLIVIPNSGLVTTEQGGLAQFTVTLAAKPKQDVNLLIQSSDISEGVIQSGGNLIFTTADWDAPQTVVVAGIDDILADGDMLYSIVLNPLVSDDNDFNGFDPDDVGATNLDDPNELPIATAQSLITEEDVPLLIILNGSDVNGDTLQAVVTTLPLQGSLYQTSDGTTLGILITQTPTTVTDSGNRVIYVPPTNQFGPNLGDFEFRVFDGLASSAPVAVNIEGQSINDAPTHAVPALFNVDEDTPISFGSIYGLEVKLTDVDAGGSLVETTLKTNNGLISLFKIEGLTFSEGTGFFETLMTFTGSVQNINAALETLFFIPNFNLTGEAVIEIKTNDLGNTGDQGAKETVNQIVINYLPVNDPPITTSIPPIQIQEDGIGESVIFAVLDSDSFGPSVQLQAFVSPDTLFDPVLGISLERLPGGFLNRITLTPRPNAFGTGSVTLKITDGVNEVSQNIPVVVTPVNDGPSISSIPTVLINEDDQGKVVTLEVNDVDSAKENLVVEVTTHPEGLIIVTHPGFQGVNGAYTLELTLTPLADLSGETDITVLVKDDTSFDSTTFKTTVIPVDDIPVIELADFLQGLEDELLETVVKITDDMFDGIPVQVDAEFSNLDLISSEGIRLIPVADGYLIRLTPIPNAFGSGNLELTLRDANHTVVRELPIIIQSVPDAPRIEPILDFVSIENDAITVELRVSDIDTPLSDVSVVLSSNYDQLLPPSMMTVAGDGELRIATILPATNRHGIVEVVALAQDKDGMQYEERFQIQITPKEQVVPEPVTIRFAPQDPGDGGGKPNRIIISWLGDFLLFGKKSLSDPEFVFIQQVSSPYEIPIPSEYRFFKFVKP
ncbi:MAG: hypothetical protein HOH33_09630, partial [Verrucomicrobia bacterium]|nr:hypothetical protein [Verrucomicrobiota bacterium]